MMRWLRFLLLPLAAFCFAAPVALADIYVHTKDGRVIIVPVDRDDVDHIDILPNGAKPESESSGSAKTEVPAAPTPAAEAPAPEIPAAAPSLPQGGEFRGPVIHKAQTYRVGPDQKYKRPSDLQNIARDGDTIEIEAGEYDNDSAEWEQNDITFKGVGGRAHLHSSGNIPNGKAIWVIRGDNVTIENMEFSGAVVSDHNGAGIRAHGGKLTIRNCYFHDNEMGILSDNSGKGDITIENSEFNHQTVEGSYGHNIYIGFSKRFRLIGSYSHNADGGHEVKSRAMENYIAYNTLMDGKTGTGSYAIDLPDCGVAYIIGNVIQQGVNSGNHTAISYGAEDCEQAAPKEGYVVNNTFVNDARTGYFVTNHTGAKLLLRNNLIVGNVHLFDGPAIDDNNLVESAEAFVNRDAFDYHLAKGASAIDKGIPAGKLANGMSLVPAFEYKSPLSTMKRPVVGKLDIGAYEYTP